MDKDDYLSLQPSVEYVETRLAQLSSSSNPVFTNAVLTPNYDHAMPPAMAEPPSATSAAVTPGQEDGYQPLKPNNGIASSVFYQPLTL